LKGFGKIDSVMHKLQYNSKGTKNFKNNEPLGHRCTSQNNLFLNKILLEVSLVCA